MLEMEKFDEQTFAIKKKRIKRAFDCSKMMINLCTD